MLVLLAREKESGEIRDLGALFGSSVACLLVCCENSMSQLLFPNHDHDLRYPL